MVEALSVKRRLLEDSPKVEDPSAKCRLFDVSPEVEASSVGRRS
jgi:hypothetical protein